MFPASSGVKARNRAPAEYPEYSRRSTQSTQSTQSSCNASYRKLTESPARAPPMTGRLRVARQSRHRWTAAAGRCTRRFMSHVCANATAAHGPALLALSTASARVPCPGGGRCKARHWPVRGLAGGEASVGAHFEPRVADRFGVCEVARRHLRQSPGMDAARSWAGVQSPAART